MCHAPLRERVAAIIDLLFDGLSAPDSRAIETLRAALPRDGAELERAAGVSTLSQLYLERATYLSSHPPEPGFAGEFELHSK